MLTERSGRRGRARGALSDARGLAKDAQLADFRGKWVVLEFWGYW